MYMHAVVVSRVYASRVPTALTECTAGEKYRSCHEGVLGTTHSNVHACKCVAGSYTVHPMEGGHDRKGSWGLVMALCMPAGVFLTPCRTYKHFDKPQKHYYMKS